mgnify:CR=1 FL=1
MNTLIPQIRALSKNSNEVVTGYYAYKPVMNKHFILREEFIPYSRETVFEEIEIIPETVEVIIIHNSN